MSYGRSAPELLLVGEDMSGLAGWALATMFMPVIAA